MKTSVQNHHKVTFIGFLMCVIQVNVFTGASLTITQYPQYANVSTSASLTCHIPSFTSGAEWFNNGVALTLCQSSLCIPPSSARYQYSANATAMTVTISSVDIALDNNTWTCSHNSGADIGEINLIVYKLPSALYINGIDSIILYEGDTVKLSVSTGCIHPSGSANYIVIWKYVETTSATENNFGTIIVQNVTSVGGCQNTYEDNLTFNLFLTNDMNTGNTTVSISQVKMTFTMAGISFYATKSVTYNVTSSGTAAPTTTTPKPGKTCDTVVGFAVGFGLGIPIALIIIVVVILICTGCKRPMWFGILLVIGLCIIFIICCIIIIILIVADITTCKVELGLGLGLSSGLILLIVFIIAVIFKCCSCSKFNEDDSIYAYVGTDADFSFMLTEDSNEAEVLIKNKSGGIVMTVHGKKGRSDDSLYKDRVTFTGNTKQMQISFILRNVTLADAGIYTAVHSDTKRTIGHQELKVKEVSPVETCVGTDADFSFMLNEDSDEVAIKKKSGDILMIAHGKKGRSDDPSSYKDRVTFTGDTNQLQISFILRNVTLEDAGIYTAVLTNPVKTIGCQKLIVTVKKSKTNNSGPPAFHTGTQNKVEPGAISNQTNDRQQPMTPIRPQPVPPQNGEIKDRSRRGISATLEDAQGLANDTPRPARLLPLPLKQETIQNEDASKERRKKRKKNKKKDQINEETPEEENGKTNLSVN